MRRLLMAKPTPWIRCSSAGFSFQKRVYPPFSPLAALHQPVGFWRVQQCQFGTLQLSGEDGSLSFRLVAGYVTDHAGVFPLDAVVQTGIFKADYFFI